MGSELHDFDVDPAQEGPQPGPSWANKRWPITDAASGDDLTQAMDPMAMKVAIKEAAKKAGVVYFCSSSLRFAATTQAVAQGSIGKVKTAYTTSPASLEPHHPDLDRGRVHLKRFDSRRDKPGPAGSLGKLLASDNLVRIAERHTAYHKFVYLLHAEQRVEGFVV